MPDTEELKNVPGSDVEQLISDYKSEGAEVDVFQQSDGNWTIRATFPD